MNRRIFLSSSFSYGILAMTLPHLSYSSNSRSETGFFSVENRKNRWWLITPEGKLFFSIGINHVDPASLRYPENIDIWKEKYNGSTTTWLKKSVAKN